jgi:hypothetical protein
LNASNVSNASRGKWALVTLVLVPASIAFVGKTLATFAAIIERHLTITYDVWFEIGMVVGQVLFQWLFLGRRPWRDRLEYATVLLFVSTLGAVLLWPMLVWNRSNEVIALAWFFAVVAIMFAVHWILVKRRELPTLLCATWVVYRLLILLFIVKRPA